jgi:hypothetical protein
MKKTALLLALSLLATPPALATVERSYAVSLITNGTPVYLGTIVASTTKNNHDTASPFNDTGDALEGKFLLVQCDAAAYVLPGTANTTTVTTSNGVKLAADERVILSMAAGYKWLAALAVTGTANCKVWELD